MQLLLLCQSERCTRPPCSRTAAPDGATTHILVRRLAQRRHGQLSTCRIEPAGRSNAPGDWPDARLGLGQREVGRGERWRCSAGAGGVLSRPFASIAKPALFGKVLLHRVLHCARRFCPLGELVGPLRSRRNTAGAGADRPGLRRARRGFIGMASFPKALRGSFSQPPGRKAPAGACAGGSRVTPGGYRAEGRRCALRARWSRCGRA